MHVQKIKTAIIGNGFVTEFFHIPLIHAVPGFDLVAIGSARSGKSNSSSGHSVPVIPISDVIADPGIDLIIVTSVNALHFSHAKAALEAGKHVVVEKPLTPTLREARELVAIAERERKILTVFQNRRWDSDFLTVSDAIKKGRLGEVVHFESHIDRYAPVVPDAWRETPGPAAGTWFDLGPHVGDQALLQFGLPQRVVASFSVQRNGAQTDDWFTVILEYENLRVVLRGTQLVPGCGIRFLVHGKQRTIVKYDQDVQERQLLDGLTPLDPGFGEDPDDALLIEPSGRIPVAATTGAQSMFYVLLEKAIRCEGPSPVTFAEALAVMALLETAASCARDGVARALPLSNEEVMAFENARCSSV